MGSHGESWPQSLKLSYSGVAKYYNVQLLKTFHGHLNGECATIDLL